MCSFDAGDLGRGATFSTAVAVLVSVLLVQPPHDQASSLGNYDIVFFVLATDAPALPSSNGSIVL